jgi:hypothetical protein
LSKFLPSQAQLEHFKLGQFLKEKGDDFPKVTHHFNIPSRTVFRSGVIFPSEIFPTSGGPKDSILSGNLSFNEIIRATSYHHEFPSGALTGLATSLKWPITPIFPVKLYS